MKLNLKPQCAKCGKEMGHHEMRALEDGSGFVCINCYENADSPSFSGGRKLREPKKESTQKIDSEETFFEQKEYVCDACNYKFKRNPEFLVNTCPFCGKSGFVHQKVEQQAQEFLEE